VLKVQLRMWNVQFLEGKGTSVPKHYVINIVTYSSDWRRGLGLVIAFINRLQVVITINYYTIAALHNVQSLHTNPFSLSALVFMGL
jgi:hypothetical protein